MNNKSAGILNELIHAWPELAVCRQDIGRAFEIIAQCYYSGGKVLICGNGGSAADSEHITGELMKGFLLKRRISREDADKIRRAFPEEAEYLCENLQGALPAISLVSQTALSTAYSNDVADDMVFAQQVYGYAKEGDVLLGLSTSGNAKNVINAIRVAAAFGMKTIGFSGETGGMMKDLCHVTIRVPSRVTYKVQEYHLPVYHAICAMIEAEFFTD